MITSAGVAAGIDMSFHVVAKLLGNEIAVENREVHRVPVAAAVAGASAGLTVYQPEAPARGNYQTSSHSLALRASVVTIPRPQLPDGYNLTPSATES